MKCRVCDGENLVRVWDVPNHALTKQLLKEGQGFKTWHLEVYACESCGFMQISTPLEQEILYENYLFPTSWKNHPHANDLIKHLVRLNPAQKSKILEIGCNDGAFLHTLRESIPCALALGIEPSSDVYELAKSKGLEVLNDFFDFTISESLKEQYGVFDVIYSRHVFEHIQDISSFLKGVSNLAHEKTIIMIEVPNCQSAIKAGDMSFIWEEHVSYFTPSHLEFVLQKHGFEVFESANYEFSGESFVCFARIKTQNTESQATHDALEDRFAQHIADSLAFPTTQKQRVAHILSILQDVKSSGGAILALGGGGIV